MNSISILRISILIFLFSYFTKGVQSQVYDRRGQTIYVEIAGSGFPYSVNYESRFSEKTNGLGGRVGIGFVGDILTVPLMLNYMVGKKDSNHFFEIGGGITYYYYPNSLKIGDQIFKQQTMGALSFMYRRHPRYGKFLFRVGITPLIGYWDEDDEGKAILGVLPMFGISFGKAF